MRLFFTLCVLFAAASSRAATQAPDGMALFHENCKKCHGVIGKPPVAMQKKYEKIAEFNAEFIAKRTVDSVVKVLTKGKGDDMKSFKDKMTPEEIAAVAKYVHELASKVKP